MHEQLQSETSADLAKPAQGPCANPACACGPTCQCGEGCACTPASNCAD